MIKYYDVGMGENKDITIFQDQSTDAKNVKMILKP